MGIGAFAPTIAAELATILHTDGCEAALRGETHRANPHAKLSEEWREWNRGLLAGERMKRSASLEAAIVAHFKKGK